MTSHSAPQLPPPLYHQRIFPNFSSNPSDFSGAKYTHIIESLHKSRYQPLNSAYYPSGRPPRKVYSPNDSRRWRHVPKRPGAQSRAVVTFSSKSVARAKLFTRHRRRRWMTGKRRRPISKSHYGRHEAPPYMLTMQYRNSMTYAVVSAV